MPKTLTWPQPGGHDVSTQGSRAGGFLSVAQSPGVTGASGPSASCTHVTFCVATSAPQIAEHASDISHLRMAQDSHRFLPPPSGPASAIRPCFCHWALPPPSGTIGPCLCHRAPSGPASAIGPCLCHRAVSAVQRSAQGGSEAAPPHPDSQWGPTEKQGQDLSPKSRMNCYQRCARPPRPVAQA